MTTFQLAMLIGAGVGMSTITGSLIAFSIKNISHKVNDIILSFAAGIMLAATVFSLIIPSLEVKGSSIYLTIIGIFIGALFISYMDKIIPHIHNFIGSSPEQIENQYLSKVMLFVMAIAIHNFPEGIAVGVSFGTENISNALSIAIGISLQNIPEGLITIYPLLSAGVSRKKAMLIALITGSTEFVGVLVGFATVSLAESILPISLAFAGGTMLYVISDEMIPETHSHGYEKTATFSLIIGFCAMLLIDFLL